MSKEIKIALLTLTSLFILFYGYYYLRGSDIFGTQKKYYAVYSDVDGLQRSNFVQVNGFTVGMITDITFHPAKKGFLIVEFQIDETTLEIPKGSVAKIASLDLLGTKGLRLELSDSHEFISIGDTIPSGVQISLKDEVNRQVQPLKLKVESLISQFDSTFQVIQGIFDQDFRNNVSTRLNNTFISLENIAHVTDVMMITNAQKITNTMGNLESVSGNLKQNNEKLTHIIDNTSAITDSLSNIHIAETFKKVDDAILDFKEVMDKINRGECSAGKLLNDDKLYTNLEEATVELDKLLEDMRVNPKRYVHFSLFGKSEKEEDKPQKKDRTQ